VVIFGHEKFCSYLLGVEVTDYTDHYVIKYMLSKNDLKPTSIGWVSLLQEFHLEIRD